MCAPRSSIAKFHARAFRAGDNRRGASHTTGSVRGRARSLVTPIRRDSTRITDGSTTASPAPHRRSKGSPWRHTDRAAHRRGRRPPPAGAVVFGVRTPSGPLTNDDRRHPAHDTSCGRAASRGPPRARLPNPPHAPRRDLTMASADLADGPRERLLPKLAPAEALAAAPASEIDIGEPHRCDYPRLSARG